MVQFGVHRFNGAGSGVTPYLVVVQSSLFREQPRRIAVPLIRRDRLLGPVDRVLNPQFIIENTEVVLATLDLASFPLRAFGDHVTSLRGRSDDIQAALDLALSRAWD